MKFLKAVSAIVLCCVIVILSGCGNTLTLNNTELKIGVDGLEGNYNPFYVTSQADLEVVCQMFRPIQRASSDNTLINHSGGISYEFVGANQVKYTVSIDDDMYFSDGTHITIDDVISFYHFIADASYDGIYKDWYLNDIVGVKEYYFDDKNYLESIENIETKISENYTITTIDNGDLADYLVETNLEGKYSGFNEKSPSGDTWKERLVKNGYGYRIEELGDNPSDERLLTLTAVAEAETNPLEYNPEMWYREWFYSSYLKKNYDDGVDVESIEGIKKINDYTCSILFNSKNINAVSEINVPLIPRSSYSAEYVKGLSSTVKEIPYFAVGSGPYIISESSEKEVSMSVNEFYNDADCEFDKLRFIDLAAKKDDPIKSVISGDVDVIKTVATSDAVNALKDAPVQYFINDCNYYVSLFFNTRTLDLEARSAIMGLCSSKQTVDEKIGSYYTGLISPISIRFEEYPENIDESAYPKTDFDFYLKLNSAAVREATVYYCGSENDLEYDYLTSLKSTLAEKQFTLEIVIADEETLESAITSGKADMWLERIYDGATCDKYNYYNSVGADNKTALKSAEIDVLTEKIHSSVGFSDKSQATEELMKLVMAQAVEYPIYQPQTLTVYNTETVNPDSFAEIGEYDGYTFFIPYLKKI